MNTAECLMRVRKLIESGWTKGAYARDESGEEVDPNSLYAKQWCLLGAMHMVSDDCPEDVDPGDLFDDMIYALKRVFPTGPTTFHIGHFNDRPGTTLADVLSALDLAIAKAGERGLES